MVEYNLSCQEINHPLVNGVIAFDKRSFSSQYSVSSPSSDSQPAITTIKVGDASVTGDYYYYDFLNGKVNRTWYAYIKHYKDKSSRTDEIIRWIEK